MSSKSGTICPSLSPVQVSEIRIGLLSGSIGGLPDRARRCARLLSSYLTTVRGASHRGPAGAKQGIDSFVRSGYRLGRFFQREAPFRGTAAWCKGIRRSSVRCAQAASRIGLFVVGGRAGARGGSRAEGNPQLADPLHATDGAEAVRRFDSSAPASLASGPRLQE